MVLKGLSEAPASEKLLILKAALELALTLLERVGDLRALSVASSCLDFTSGMIKAKDRTTFCSCLL